MPQITPNKSDNEVLYIEELKEAQEEGENFYNVYLLDRSNNETYSIEAVPWADVLGYTVDIKQAFQRMAMSNLRRWCCMR